MSKRDANNARRRTGALMDQALLEQVAAMWDACGAYVLCDEVFWTIWQINTSGGSVARSQLARCCGRASSSSR